MNVYSNDSPMQERDELVRGEELEVVHVSNAPVNSQTPHGTQNQDGSRGNMTSSNLRRLCKKILTKPDGIKISPSTVWRLCWSCSSQDGILTMVVALWYVVRGGIICSFVPFGWLVGWLVVLDG